MSDNEEMNNQQDQTNDQQNSQTLQDDPQHSNIQDPSAVSFSMEDVQRAIGMSQRTAQQALDQARELREENERLRQQNRPRAPQIDNNAINQLASEDFAGATAQIVARELDSRLSPLLEERNVAARQRKISQYVAQAINVHPYSSHLQVARQQIEAQIATMVGNSEPTLDFVSIALDGLVGRAMSQNPNVFSQPAPQPNNPNNPPVRNAPPKPPVPPNSRPSNYAPAGKKPLSESLKKLKAAMGQEAMDDEEFAELFYQDGQAREYDPMKIVKTA